MECTSFTFKIIAAGDGGVGKTSMFRKYITGKFDFETKMTIGVEIFNKDQVVENGRIASLQLWDFAGQERFRFFLDNFVLGANGVFLVFDLTRYSSFINLEKWLTIVRKYDSTIPIILIGTKFDLTDTILVKDDDALDFIEVHSIKNFMKVSSKTGYNIEEVFDLLVNDILEYKNLSTKRIQANHITPSPF